MKRTISLLMGLSVICATAYAGEEQTGELTDPVEILKKVDAAAKAVNAVKYDVVAEATGGLASRLGKVEGSVIMSGLVRNAPEKYYIDVKVTMPGANEPRKISGGSDGDTFFVVDHHGKTAYEDIDPAVTGRTAGRVFQQAMTIEFVHQTPFSDEINGRSQEMKGSVKIGDEDCYEIHVVYAAEQAPEATWAFSKKDFLPRRRIDAIPAAAAGGQAGTTIRTITNLVVDPKLDEDAFRLKLPEGYTKTDDFAPDNILSGG